MYNRALILVSSLLIACVAVMALLGALGDEVSVRAAPRAPSTELHVCSSGCAYSSIQEAVDAANPGDVVKVAQGTYTDVHVREGITQVVYISKTVAIQGGYTTSNWTTPYPMTQPTTLDAQGQGRVLVITGTITPTIEGLRITGGDATGLGGDAAGDAGGGIYMMGAAPVLSGNMIYSNTIGDGLGAGLYLVNSNAVLNNNVIHNNSGSTYGSLGTVTLAQSPAELNGNLIYSNTVTHGGGLFLSSSDATFNNNVITGNTAVGEGGALQLVRSNPTLNGDILRGNTAGWGGGLSMENESDATLVNMVIADNRAIIEGSGLYIKSCSPLLLQTTIAHNSGGDGSGLYVTDYGWYYSSVVMTNTIIVSHTVGVTVTGSSTVTLDTTLWHANAADWSGNVSSDNDYHQDPGLDLDGYHLVTGSFAIDRGVDAGVTVDVDGDARPQGAGFDIGADEFPAGKPDITWVKAVRVNDDAFQDYGEGPFSVVPGDVVTVVDRVWVTTTWDISFTLGEGWSPSLVWDGYQATTGTVSPAADSATWSASGAAPNAWHTLTKTWQVTDSAEYADTLTETLTVEGLAVQLPERILRFQHARPQPTWEKMIRISDGSFQSWDAGPFTVNAGDVMTVVDRVRITHTADISFTLAEDWGTGLDLQGWSNDAGTVTTGTGTLSWRGSDAAPDQWHALTTTWRVGSGTWLQETLTETLTIAGLDPQLPRRTVSVINLGASTGCYARINDGTTIYPTVQTAVDAAQPGDLVKVAGTCSAVNSYGDLAQVVYLDKSLTIRGGYMSTNWTTPDPAAHPTTLDAQGKGRVLYITGNISPTIQGLRITGGDAKGLGGHIGGDDSGGGIYIHTAQAVITDNVAFSNTAVIGGGLYLNASAATIAGNAVTSNTTQDSGGGLYLYWSNGATLHKNTIAANLADFGGGAFLHHSGATLGENKISNNLARKDSGGVAVGSSSATLRANFISGNQANHTAGGLSLYSCYGALLEGNVIVANTAGHNAGGMWLDASDVTLINNAIVKNKAGAAGSGIYVQAAKVWMVHTTVAQNTGGDGSGLHVVASHPNYSTLVLTNTIIADHRVGITVTTGNEAALNSTLWHGNTVTDTGGAGSVTTANDHHGNPALAPDGYHLTLASAAIDRGVDAGVDVDLDGQSRPQDSGYDLGADEFVPIAPTGVSIGGPTVGLIDESYTFTATVSPPEATTPITYTWTPMPVGGQGTNVAAYSWSTPGTKTISVTAENIAGAAPLEMHTIHIEKHKIYLPLVMRS